MDTLFFFLSKILWSFVSPDTLLLYLLLAGCVCLWLQKLRAAKVLLGFVVGSLLLIAFLPVGPWLLYPLESRFPANPPLPQRVDGIVLLGGSVDALASAAWNQTELNDAAERNLAFVELARRFPSAKLVMSGGSGSLRDQEYREADVTRQLYDTLGLDHARILFERESRNTIENARNSKALASPQPGETWILVTSAFHMPRSVGVFCEIDWHVLPWPVDHRTSPIALTRMELNLAAHLMMMTNALHEWAGLLSYYLSGRIPSPFPLTCPTPE